MLDLHPGAREGELTRQRGWIVSARCLTQAAQLIQLGRFLRLSSAEEAIGGRQKQRLLANAMEAVLAAVYRDGGYAPAAAVVDRLILDPCRAQFRPGGLNEFTFKSSLQEWAHAARQPLPVYHLVSTTGPEHAKRFTVEVRLADGTLGTGSGLSKKEAEQRAAAAALAALGRPS